MSEEVRKEEHEEMVETVLEKINQMKKLEDEGKINAKEMSRVAQIIGSIGHGLKLLSMGQLAIAGLKQKGTKEALGMLKSAFSILEMNVKDEFRRAIDAPEEDNKKPSYARTCYEGSEEFVGRDG